MFVCVLYVFRIGIKVVVEKTQVGRKGRGREKAASDMPRCLQKSNDPEKGRRQHPGTQA